MPVPVSVHPTRFFQRTTPCLPEAEAQVQGKEFWTTPSAEHRSTHITIQTCEPLFERLVQTQQYHLPLQHDTRPTMRQAQFSTPEGAQNL